MIGPRFRQRPGRPIRSPGFDNENQPQHLIHDIRVAPPALIPTHTGFVGGVANLRRHKHVITLANLTSTVSESNVWKTLGAAAQLRFVRFLEHPESGMSFGRRRVLEHPA